MRDNRTRMPSSAGLFYPASAESLRRDLEECFSRAPGRTAGPDAAAPLALIAPHAGIQYSGITAAAAWKAVPQEYACDLLVVLGPNHTGLGPSVSVSDAQSWKTVFGEILLDEEARQSICADVPEAGADSLGHLREHSLELQMPFAEMRLAPGFKLLAITLGLEATPEGLDVCRRLGRAIRQAASGKTTLVVASTDMSHYLSDALVRRADAPALAAIVDMDEEQLVTVVRENRITMCGCMPVAALLAASRAMGGRQIYRTDYRTSGDATGDFSRVVAYASFVIR